MEHYSFFQKLLHDFVFSTKVINKSLFEIEKIFFLKKIKIKNHSHIFITGLPRSGTTSLLNFIYSSKQYASLTYRSMPFILSPNFSKLFYKKNIEKKERMHGDGIAYDIDSPEAFDEIFFRNSKEFIEEELVNYLTLILISENKIKYLSKNNLNFKRINLISSIFRNCKFLIPIRDPLQHAYSLMNQHIHFSKLQKNNDFIRRYMNYLGHNEFGLNHQPWNKPIDFHNLNQLNYWLEQWYLFYKNILDNFQFHDNCYFVIYEELENSDYVHFLIKKMNIETFEKLNLNYFTNYNKKININYSRTIYEKAKNLHEDFRKNLR